jgi:hypothetical protein
MDARTIHIRTLHGYPIIARKPRGVQPDAEVIIVDRGSAQMGRYVTAVLTLDTAQHNEWVWGHYFRTLDEATADFHARG